VDENIENGNNVISATEVVEFDEHAKQVIEDNMVEVWVCNMRNRVKQLNI